MLVILKLTQKIKDLASVKLAIEIPILTVKEIPILTNTMRYQY